MRNFGFLNKYSNILRKQGGSMVGAAEMIEAAIMEYRKAEAALAEVGEADPLRGEAEAALRRAKEVVDVFIDEAAAAAFGGGGVSEYFVEFEEKGNVKDS